MGETVKNGDHRPPFADLFVLVDMIPVGNAHKRRAPLEAGDDIFAGDAFRSIRWANRHENMSQSCAWKARFEPEKPTSRVRTISDLKQQ